MWKIQIVLRERSDKTLLYIDGCYVTSFAGNANYVKSWLARNVQNYEIVKVE